MQNYVHLTQNVHKKLNIRTKLIFQGYKNLLKVKMSDSADSWPGNLTEYLKPGHHLINNYLFLIINASLKIII